MPQIEFWGSKFWHLYSFPICCFFIFFISSWKSWEGLSSSNSFLPLFGHRQSIVVNFCRDIEPLFSLSSPTLHGISFSKQGSNSSSFSPTCRWRGLDRDERRLLSYCHYSLVCVSRRFLHACHMLISSCQIKFFNLLQFFSNQGWKRSVSKE